jgi:hypothetical protein
MPVKRSSQPYLAPRALVTVLGLAVLLAGADARADGSAPPSKAACVAAFEQGQELERAGRLVEASEQFVTCSAEACPTAVRSDCLASRASLEKSLPSIVLGARDGKGNDLVDVDVLLDGHAFAKKLDGRPLVVDPGPHTLRFEAQGVAPVERQVVIRVGEKNRVFTVDLAPGPGAAPPGTTTKEAPAAPSGSNGRRIGAYVVGGLGLVSLGAFAYLGLSGKQELSDLRDTCGKTHGCAEADVNATKTRLIAADVSLGVGILALGAATWLFVTSRGNAEAPASSAIVWTPIVAPLPGGGAAGVSARF